MRRYEGAREDGDFQAELYAWMGLQQLDEERLLFEAKERRRQRAAYSPREPMSWQDHLAEPIYDPVVDIPFNFDYPSPPVPPTSAPSPRLSQFVTPPDSPLSYDYERTPLRENIIFNNPPQSPDSVIFDPIEPPFTPPYV